MNFSEFISNLQICSAIISILLNSILLILIIKKSPTQLGSYRYLMIYISIFEVFFSILDVFLSPTVFSHGSMSLVFISTKNRIFSKSTYLILNCVWNGCIGCFMAFFAIQFIYRFFVINRSKILKSFDDYRILLWMLIPLFVGLLWCIDVYVLMGPTYETEQVIRDILLSSLEIKIEDISYIGVRCYEQSIDAIIYKGVISIIIVLIISSISFIVVVIFGIKTFVKLNDLFKIGNSKSYNNLQLQTFYALVSQTVIPMILMHFPCFIVFILTISNFELGHISSIITVTFALFPALDPLPVMLIIKNYRGTLFNVVSTPVNIFVRRKIVI